jgi:hypothetical protein
LLAPLALLLAWIGTFGCVALGRFTLAFDDHPGQLYRAWLVATSGIAPYRWHEGWWGGYAELQFYPPGHAYAVALLDRIAFGALGLDAAYQMILWLAYALPGFTAWLLLARVLQNGWLALPGAFVVLSLSAGVASGVEGGVHIGMVPARLGWAMLPLLVLALLPAVDAPAAGRAAARGWGTRTPLLILLVAVIVLMHPAHIPAAAIAVVLAAMQARSAGTVRHRLADALLVLACAAGLSAFWSLPLLVRAVETRALAWGSIASSLAELGREPLMIVALVLAIVAHRHARTPPTRLLANYPWAVSVAVALDAVVLEPLGIRSLPSARVLDSAVLAFVLAAAVGAVHLVHRIPVIPARAAAPALALGMVAVVVLLALPGRALTLWPARGQWPSLAEVERGLRLDALWAQLREAPAGRVLFVRSAVPLVYGTDWWRPHTHVTALAPRESGRSIVHGTFTHPSPVAAFVYRGDAGRAPVRALTETLDGHSLFGIRLTALDAMRFEHHADRLGISVVVAIEDDRPALGFLDTSQQFRRVPSTAPFLLWMTSTPVSLPQDAGHGTRAVTLHGEPGAWTTSRVAYSPLWRAVDTAGRALDVRRGEAGDLEVRLPDARVDVRLVYQPGLPELAGVITSLVACATWIAVSVIAAGRGRVSAPARVPDARRALPGGRARS